MEKLNASRIPGLGKTKPNQLLKSRVWASTSLIIIALAVSAIPASHAYTSTATPHSASSDKIAIEDRVHSLISNMKKNRAISLTLDSPQFQSLARGHPIQFHSIFTTWSIRPGGT